MLVVENGGRDGVEAICSAAPAHLNIRYLYHEAGNKSAALNRALEETGDELLIFLDDDVRLEPQTLCAYATAAAEAENRAFFGGPVQPEYEVPPEPWIRLPLSASGWSLPDGDQEVDQPLFLGFNWAAWASDLREQGGFDPAVGPGGASMGRGQESEMQQRLLHSQVRGQYVSQALVWHYVPTSRCSVEWSIHRVYQGGIGSALVNGGQNRLLHIFKSVYRRSRSCLSAIIKIPRPIGYSLHLEATWWRGYAAGCYYLLKHPAGALPPVRPPQQRNHASPRNQSCPATAQRTALQSVSPEADTVSV